MKKLFKSKNFRHGTVATVLTVVVLAVLILVNVLVSALTDHYPLTVDLTPEKMFNLTEDSVEFVKGIDKDVTITVLTDENNFMDSFRQPYEVMKKYTQYSNRVELEFIDVVKDPTFIAQHSADLELSSGDIVVTCGSRLKKVALRDLFNIQQGYYGTTVQQSKAEQTMTSALMNVTSDQVVRAAILTGIGETETAQLEKLMTDNNYEFVKVNLLTEEIPQDAQIAVLAGPTRDPDSELIKKIDVFLDNEGEMGRSLLYFAAPTVKSEQLPNLNAFLADWGIRVNDALVLETEANHVFSYNPLNAIVDYTGEGIEEFMDTTRMMAVPNGRELETLFETESGYRTEALLSYMDTTVTMPLDQITEDGAPQVGKEMKTRPAMIQSKHSVSKGSYLVESNVIACASVDAVSDAVLSVNALANGNFAVGLMNRLAGKEDSIFIRAKNLQGQNLQITAAQVYTLMAIFIIVVPLAVMAIGLAVWLRRRHL